MRQIQQFFTILSDLAPVYIHKELPRCIKRNLWSGVREKPLDILHDFFLIERNRLENPLGQKFKKGLFTPYTGKVHKTETKFPFVLKSMLSSHLD